MATTSVPKIPPPDPAFRDELAPFYRTAIFELLGVVPFAHQARFCAALNGLRLTHTRRSPEEFLGPEAAEQDPRNLPLVVHRDEECWWLVQETVTEKVLLGEHETEPLIMDAIVEDEQGRPEVTFQYVKLGPRVSELDPEDELGSASVLAMLIAYKGGKSAISGWITASYCAVPGVTWDFFGHEYDTCAPEFSTYCREPLLNLDGFAIEAPIDNDRPDIRKMNVELRNGSKFRARSWVRFEAMKGKERDGYTGCEVYQLGSIACYTRIQQNLDYRNGKFLAPTTPDLPWVQVFTEKSNGRDPGNRSWFCESDIDRSCNPFTFNRQKMLEAYDTMPREDFLAAFGGKVGKYVGSVYQYRVGQRVFTTESHPHLWKDPDGPETIENLRIPAHYEIGGGYDAGTARSAVLMAASEDEHVFVVSEHPNYRYVAGQREMNRSMTSEEWKKGIKEAEAKLRAGAYWRYLGDKNMQWKDEFRAGNYGIRIGPGQSNLARRTTVAQDYLRAGQLWFAPWCTTTQWEFEYQKYPKGDTGSKEREKEYDECVDCVEHWLAKRPAGRQPSSVGQKVASVYEQMVAGMTGFVRSRGHPLLGRLAR